VISCFSVAINTRIHYHFSISFCVLAVGPSTVASGLPSPEVSPLIEFFGYATGPQKNGAKQSKSHMYVFKIKIQQNLPNSSPQGD